MVGGPRAWGPVEVARVDVQRDLGLVRSVQCGDAAQMAEDLVADATGIDDDMVVTNSNQRAADESDHRVERCKAARARVTATSSGL